MLKSSIAPYTNRFSNLRNITASWNAGIREAVNQGQPGKALSLFCQMKNQQNAFIKPNNLTFPFLAKACGKLSNLKYAQIIHTHVAKSPYVFDKYVQTALVDMYVKCSHLGFACAVFEEMPVRDVAAWNVMIMGFVQMGFFNEVFLLFNRMRGDDIRPDSVTIIGLTQLASGTSDVRLLSSVHCLGIERGFNADVSVANTWIAAYGKCSDLRMAEMVFDGISSEHLTVVSWNSMIAGCADVKVPCKALGVYRRMLLHGFEPDLSTILNLLASFVQPEALFYGKMIHSHGIQLGCDSDISVLNTLISMYSKCGDINSARHIFDNMIQKTCVSWTAMIGGYCENGNLEAALSLFHAMELSGVKFDLVTVVHLISACGQTGALGVGRWLENYAFSKGLKEEVVVCNALLDMYAKCGSMTEARELFRTMSERTVVSWTTMISGFALNGAYKEALDHFHLMLGLGLKPNQITFLAVLQACTHSGLLDKGQEYLDLMTMVYKIKPSLDHYACIADLLGRRGRLREALKLIKNMPVKPDAGIWASLLSACKVHRNLEMGEYAAERLFEIDPKTAAPYVEMANIYASAGRWDGVAAMRARMKCNKVTKFPGQSIIQVNGKSYTFTVEDRCHVEGFVIYETLNGLSLQLKDQLDSSNEDEIFNLFLLD